MSAQSLFNTVVKGVAEQLAGYGFERDKMVFRRFSPEGDVLIIELQISDHSTKAEKIFYINVAFVLAPKWERDRQKFNLPASELPRHFHGIWQHRIGFTRLSGGDQWKITDEASAAKVSQQLRQRLDETVPQLLPLLNRDTVLGDAPEFFRWTVWSVRGWVLAENGPSEELQQMLFEPTGHEFSPVAKKAIWEYAEWRSEAMQGQR